LSAPLSTIAPSVYRAASNLATPYSQQATIAVQHQLGRDLTATASYLFVRGVKLSRTRNINLLPSGPDFGAGRVHANYDNVYELEDAANSRYQGLSLTLNWRNVERTGVFSELYTVQDLG
jgi:hypothetical protein